MIITKELLQEHDLEFTNSREDLVEVTLFKGKINIWLNGSITNSSKSVKTSQNKLDFLISL